MTCKLFPTVGLPVFWCTVDVGFGNLDDKGKYTWIWRRGTICSFIVCYLFRTLIICWTGESVGRHSPEHHSRGIKCEAKVDSVTLRVYSLSRPCHPRAIAHWGFSGNFVIILPVTQRIWSFRYKWWFWNIKLYCTVLCHLGDIRCPQWQEAQYPAPTASSK